MSAILKSRTATPAPPAAVPQAQRAADLRDLFGLEHEVDSTAAQREIFSASMLDSAASRAYNHSISVFLDGELDRDALYSAILNLIHRHEALRGRFSDDGLRFIVRERIACELPLVDLRRGGDHDGQLAYEEFVREELDHVFDLLEGPLFRAALIWRQEHRWVMIFNCHHSVVDGWSLKIILDELPRLYSALVSGNNGIALAPAASYLEYLRSAAARETEQAQIVRDYWRGVYAEQAPVLDLPVDNPRPRWRTYESLREDYRIDRRVYAQLKAVGARYGASQFVSLLSVFALYMHRLSGQSDLVLGVPAAGQVSSGKSGLIGHDARVMPIRCLLEGLDTYITYVRRARERFLSAYEHQWIALPDLLQELGIEFNRSRMPLVAIMFNFDPGMDESAFRFEGLQARHFFNHRNADTFEMSVNAVVDGEDLVLEWTYNRTLFDRDEMLLRVAQFEQLMRSIAEKPDAPIASLQWVPAAQIALMDRTLNSTGLDFERALCVDQWIGRSVHVAPEKIAVEFASDRLSYQQLWERSSQIAEAVLAANPGPQPIIGVMLERSADMVAVLLGVWRAGGAFLPLDPAYPADRLDYMIEHSGMQLLLEEKGLALAQRSGRVRVIDIGDIDPAAPQTRLPQQLRDSDHLAYVIYTSGSTGRPKGVPVTHRALNNLLRTMLVQAPGMNPDDRLLAVTTLSFDIAQLELWLPLVAGATTVIADRATAIDGRALARVLRESCISFLQATPSTWRTLLLTGWEGNTQLTALCGGEALSPDLAADLRGRVGHLWNAYGPTETTVWATIGRVETGPITIGKPLGNYQAYVLDAQQAWVGRGCLGELWISGEGVAQGYLRREDLTRERFVPNPFSGRGTMYRTGDLVRLRRDGNIEYVGRTDFQVKVRGYRIELGEVQLVLSRLPKIRQCVVIVRERTPGDTHLVAYFTLNGTEQVTAKELKTGLQKFLPEYMVPGWYVELQQLPLTDNGKLNFKALPDPFESNGRSARPALEPAVMPATTEEHSAAMSAGIRADSNSPRTDTEIAIAALWCEMLFLPRVGIRESFFDLGGTSLVAVALMARLGDQLQMDVPASRLLAYPTIEELAASLDSPDCGIAKPTSQILRLREGGPRNMFFVHDADGEVLLYRTLAQRLPSPFSVFGVLPRTRPNIPLLGRTVEEIAASYLQAVRDIQPHGPYYLAGLCAGGVIAFEMAAQLESLGEKVGLIAIMDAMEPQSYPKLQLRMRRRFARFSSVFSPRDPDLRSGIRGFLYRGAIVVAARKITSALRYEISSFVRRACVVARLWILKLVLKYELAWPELIPSLTRREIFFGALDSYTTKILRFTRVAVIKASEGVDANDPMTDRIEDPTLGWGRVAGGNLQIISVPGGHSSMLQTPYVHALGLQFTSLLEDARRSEMT
ncbi:MAG: amino acid adenylation domain-containing protein [Steroidobacterales bacterium]